MAVAPAQLPSRPAITALSSFVHPRPSPILTRLKNQPSITHASSQEQLTGVGPRAAATAAPRAQQHGPSAGPNQLKAGVQVTLACQHRPQTGQQPASATRASPEQAPADGADTGLCVRAAQTSSFSIPSARSRASPSPKQNISPRDADEQLVRAGPCVSRSKQQLKRLRRCQHAC
jgi:hypothetical protein